jgi:hypothetical protein
MSKASDEIIKKSKAIREINDSPMAIIQGIIPVVMGYVQTRQITRNGGIEAAARILAIIEMADEKEVPAQAKMSSFPKDIKKAVMPTTM